MSALRILSRRSRRSSTISNIKMKETPRHRDSAPPKAVRKFAPPTCIRY